MDRGVHPSLSSIDVSTVASDIIRSLGGCPSCGAHLPGYKPVLRHHRRRPRGNRLACGVFLRSGVPRIAILARARPSKTPSWSSNRRASAIRRYSVKRVPWPTSSSTRTNVCGISPNSNRSDRSRAGSCSRSRPLEPRAYGFAADSRNPEPRLAKSDAFTSGLVTDAAGAGDWCTAGLIALHAAVWRGFASRPETVWRPSVWPSLGSVELRIRRRPRRHVPSGQARLRVPSRKNPDWFRGATETPRSKSVKNRR